VADRGGGGARRHGRDRSQLSRGGEAAPFGIYLRRGTGTDLELADGQGLALDAVGHGGAVAVGVVHRGSGGYQQVDDSPLGEGSYRVIASRTAGTTSVAQRARAW